VPTNTDTAFFQYADPQTVLVTNNVSVTGLIFNNKDSPGGYIWLRDNSGAATVTIGSGGLTVDSASGPPIIGNGLSVLINGSQTWAVNGSTLTISNSMANAGTTAATLTLEENGGQSISLYGAINDGGGAGALGLNASFPNGGSINLYSANSTYSGGSIFRAGTFFVKIDVAAGTANDALGTGPVTLGDTSADPSAVIFEPGNGTYANTFQLASGTTGAIEIRPRAGGGSVNLTGGFTGANSLEALVNGAGSLTFSGLVNYTGSFTVAATATAGGYVAVPAAIGNNVTSVNVASNSAAGNLASLILSGTNTYSGPTIIGGTLALTGTGSISNSSSISIGAAGVFGGGTLDVSGITGGIFNLSSQTALSVVGTANGNAVINGAIGGTVNLGSQPVYLTFAPATLTGDVVHPALSVVNATLVLNGNAFTVTNAAAAPLGAGVYLLATNVGSLILVNGSDAVTVLGAGAVAGTSSRLDAVGGGLYLTVTFPVVTPVINSEMFNNGTLGLSFSGTNGQPYQVLASTNLLLPLTNWSVLTSGTFGVGAATYTDPNATNPQEFYLITSP
jgi:hypothetical protein